MIVLITDGSGDATSEEIELKGGLPYVLSFTNRSTEDDDGSVNGVTGGTMTPAVIWSAPYERITTPAVAAAVTTALSGANNDLVFTAVLAGLAGNSITVEGVDTGVPNQALTFEVSAAAITVHLALDAGTAQVETMTIVGTAGADGMVSWSFNSALTGLIEGTVDVENGDTAVDIGGLILAAMQSNETITEHWTLGAGGDEDVIIATAKVAAADDGTANMAYAAVSPLTGITDDATSTNTTAGVAPAITTTGDLFKTGLLASTEASALITAADAGGNDGSGLMPAFGPISLAAGADAVTTDEQPISPLIDEAGAEIVFDLTTPVGGIEFIAPADGTLKLTVAGAGDTKTLFANAARSRTIQ